MKRSRTAVLVAVGVAFGLVLGGTATAVAVSSAKAVKVCTTTSGVVRTADAKGRCPAKTKKRAVSVRGPVGPRGATGARGPAGSAASTKAYFGQAPSSRRIDNWDNAVVTLDLPAGTYTLAANANLEAVGATTGYMGGIGVVSCWVPGYRTGSVYLSPKGTYGGERESLTMNSAVTLPGGPVSLVCTSLWNDAWLWSASLVATRVGALG